MGIQVGIGRARWRPRARQQGHLVLGPTLPEDWRVGLLLGGAPLPGEGPTSPAWRAGVERENRVGLGNEGTLSWYFQSKQFGVGRRQVLGRRNSMCKGTGACNSWGVQRAACSPVCMQDRASPGSASQARLGSLGAALKTLGRHAWRGLKQGWDQAELCVRWAVGGMQRERRAVSGQGKGQAVPLALSLQDRSPGWEGDRREGPAWGELGRGWERPGGGCEDPAPSRALQ